MTEKFSGKGIPDGISEANFQTGPGDALDAYLDDLQRLISGGSADGLTQAVQMWHRLLREPRVDGKLLTTLSHRIPVVDEGEWYLARRTDL